MVVGATPAELERAGLHPRGPRLPRVPASADQGRTRARAPRTQGRPRLSRLHHRIFADGDARRRPAPSRPHHQCHGRRRGRQRHRSLRRTARSRGAPAAARLRGFRGGPGAHPARGALRRAVCAAGFRSRRGNAGAHAAHGRRRRSQCAGRRTRLDRNREGAGRAQPRRVHLRAARLRRAEGRLPGDRCAVRRAAAGEMAPRNRHRRAPAVGAARRGEPWAVASRCASPC